MIVWDGHVVNCKSIEQLSEWNGVWGLTVVDHLWFLYIIHDEQIVEECKRGWYFIAPDTAFIRCEKQLGMKMNMVMTHKVKRYP